MVERMAVNHYVAGSIPASRVGGYSLEVEHWPSKPLARVRFPLAACSKNKNRRYILINERKKNTSLAKGHAEVLHPNKSEQDRMPSADRPRVKKAQQWLAHMQKERPSGIGLNG